MGFLEDFKQPPVKNRIKPFWFWNGDMTEAQIQFQIREMAEKGLGGAFICPRQGLLLPYLSGEWFRRVRFACEKANEAGIENWLYDEYPYPSGMSGGEVLLRHPEAEQQILQCLTIHAENGQEVCCPLGWGEVLYAKAFSDDWTEELDLRSEIGILQTEEIYQQTGLTSYNHKRYFSYGPKHVLQTMLPEGYHKIMIYYQEPMGDFKYYGGFFDPCNREAVRTFLDTTHEKYKEHLGQQFGKTIHGMFSDEVGLLGKLPWSRQLLPQFEKETGYSLLDVLPALHNRDYPDAAKIRYDYLDVLHRLFVSSYHKQVTDWCRENHLSYATEVPSMRMSTQRYSDVIGGDTAHEKLGRPLEWIYDKYLGNLRYNAKSTGSLARQLDKEYAMIESFHSIGWSMTMQDAKWMIDRLGSDGINLFNFHAFYYTINSITKHDAPPSQFIQNPYWKHYRLLADYTGRMSVLNTYTTVSADIAVLDPIASLWSHLANPFHDFNYGGCDLDEEAECRKIFTDWKEVCKSILFEQWNYDHLDTEILQDAKISDGKIQLGRVSYTILVVPPITMLEDYAIAKIYEFLDNGGKVLQLGEVDFFSQDSRIRYVSDKNELIPALGTIYQPAVQFLTAKDRRKDFITSVRQGKRGETMVLICNQGGAYADGVLSFQTDVFAGASFWDLETGEIQPALVKSGQVELKFAPYQSFCLELTKKPGFEKVQEKARLTISTQEPMAVAAEGENILRFEYFDLSLDNVTWTRTDTKTIIEQLAETAALKGSDIRYTGMFGTPRKLTPAYPFPVYYKTEFMVAELPEQAGLLMDTGSITGSYTIKLNDVLLPPEKWESVFVNDQNNIRQEVAPLLKKGDNLLEIQVLAEHDACGIRDPLYLTGSFGICDQAAVPAIGPIPEQAVYSDHYVKGFPYYSGTLTFSKSLVVTAAQAHENASQSMILEFDFKNSRYDCLEVLLDDQNLGVRAFTPYQWEIPKATLTEGEHQLKLLVTNTLANMLDGTYFDYQNHELVKIMYQW